MLRFLGGLILLTTMFILGYYFGQRPVTELKQTITNLKGTITSLTRNVLGSTMGLEQNVRWRQSLVEAKARMIQAKAEILDRNFGSATREIAKATSTLEAVRGLSRSNTTDDQVQALTRLIAKSKALQLDLLSGRAGVRKELDETLKDTDALLAK